MQSNGKKGLLSKPIFNTRVKSANVKLPEMIFGYFLGPFGALLSNGIFTSFLNKYFTDVVFAGSTMDSGVSLFLMLLPLLSTFLVIIGNLVMGQILERTRSMQGKARPWLLLSALTLSVASVLMFIMPFTSIIARMVWIGISYNLYYAVAYPIYNTANSTLIPLSTRNMKQRSLLGSITNVAGLGVMGAGSMVFPILAGFFLFPDIDTGVTAANAQTGWLVAMIIISIYCLVSLLLQFMFTRERITEEASKMEVEREKTPIIKQLKAVGTDKSWWLVIGFYLFFQVSGALKNLSMTYFTEWVIDNGFWGMDSASGAAGMSQSILAVLGAIPMAVAVVFVWPLSNKIGKKNITLIGLALGVAGGVIAGIAPTNFIAVAIGVALKCLGSAPACYLILAMIADVIDHVEAKHGFRTDGLTMSIYSSIMVAATGIATAVFNGMLGANNYDSTLPSQSDTTVGIISASYVWVETIAYGLCILLLLFFNVEKFVKDDQLTIRNRQKAEVLENGGTWIEPEERLRLEQEEAERKAEDARIAESKARCEKKGLSFDEVESAYQAKLAEKQAKKNSKAKKNDGENNDK